MEWLGIYKPTLLVAKAGLSIGISPLYLICTLTSPMSRRDGAAAPKRSWAMTDHIVQVSIEESATDKPHCTRDL
jgi:hypothetical protein